MTPEARVAMLSRLDQAYGNLVAAEQYIEEDTSPRHKIDGLKDHLREVKREITQETKT